MGITTKTGLNENGQSSSVFEGRAIGDIIPHFGTTAPPGTLVCDGSEVSREAYAELFEEIGSLVGQGDGSTTFDLPDLRGRWLMGADAERAAGAVVAEGLPDIQGTVGSMDVKLDNGTFTHAVNYVPVGAFCMEKLPQGTPGTASVQQATGASNSTYSVLQIYASRWSSIYGAQAHVTPASVAVLPCIVYE